MVPLDRLTLEVIRNAAIYASEEMGVVLRNTAYSPNIKDRLDHTCAVLTPKGELVAQAEHIPVHIGSMAVGTRMIVGWLEERGEILGPGDVVMTNDPYLSGTHLNDVTLLKPVYHQGRLVAIVADKAHHVDVGGGNPGSIGPGARELLQEGIIVPPVKIVENGVLDVEILRLLASNVRTPRLFEGDLKAQIASLNRGEARIIELAEKYGTDRLLEAWDEILSYTERYTRHRLAGLGVEGVWAAEDYLELQGNIAVIRASLELTSDSVRVDYSGSSPQVDEPLNAVYGVTVAATVYALKTVVDPDMPVNHGFFRVVEIEAPEGTIVNPRYGAPVAAGNTETSQRIVDVVYRALAQALPGRVPAASCGTMTNVMIGGSGWAFYETLGCGSGGRPVGDGVDGVHTNMTNTLNTPVERLEIEYPLLVVKYELRMDSEGPGLHRGGLGITRAYRVRGGRAVVTIVSERCSRGPWGLEGGKPGSPSKHWLVRSDGGRIDLPCKTSITLEPGDTVFVNTPGGGGYGDPCNRPRKAIVEDVLDGKISGDRAQREYCLNEAPIGVRGSGDR